MEIAIRYFSRGGNTRKVAEAIAQAVQVKAEDCTVPVAEPVDLLFLGGSVYGFGIDDTVKAYIAGLDAGNIKAVALFGTSAVVKSGNQEMAKLLREKGITVRDKDFHCWGAFTVMHRGRPKDEDLQRAAEFALAAVKEG